MKKFKVQLKTQEKKQKIKSNKNLKLAINKSVVISPKTIPESTKKTQ